MGKNNIDRDYRIQGVMLECVTWWKDLGVVRDMGGKQAAQCQAAKCEANLVFSCIWRGIKNIYIKRVVNIAQEFSEGHI